MTSTSNDEIFKPQGGSSLMVGGGSPSKLGITRDAITTVEGQTDRRSKEVIKLATIST
jgi:hypothetical protein